MGDRIATVVIEPRSLVREALVSLMESHSYRVIFSVGSAADIDRGVPMEETPELVILGALPTDRVADATSGIRRRWQGAKIIMLSEHGSSKDSLKLLASGLDACIPMSASPRTLTDALKLMVDEQLRILVVSDSAIPQAPIDPEGDHDEGYPPRASFESSPHVSACAVPGTRHGLSGREEQILKALVQGHSNKMIGRTHSVTDATVKVHMKSIMRKLRVANRTQAAIWAMQNPFSADVSGMMPKLMQATPSVNGYR